MILSPFTIKSTTLCCLRILKPLADNVDASFNRTCLEKGVNVITLYYSFYSRYKLKSCYLNLVVLESKSVIVRSDNLFFSHRLDNNCSDTSAGKKASGRLKVSRVAELKRASLDDVLPVVVSKATSVLLLFTV